MITVRSANPEDGKTVGKMLWVQGFKIHGIDWSEIDKSWLVAMDKDDIVGAMNVQPSRPIGRLEMMTVSNKLSRYRQTKVKYLLLTQGLAMLKLYGANSAMGMVPYEEKSYRKFIRRHGGVETLAGKMMFYSV